MTTLDEGTLDRRSAWLRRALSRCGLGLLVAVAPACAAEAPAPEPVAVAAEPVAWLQQSKLFGNDEQSQDRFGFTVAASGNTIVATSAFGVKGTEVHLGAAYVFVWDGSKWSQEAKLPTPVEASKGLSGKAAISGDTIVVGVASDADAGVGTGAAYVFVRKNGTWSQEARLVAMDGAAGDFFGNSVAIEGDSIVVGAVQRSEAASESGAAYVFARSDGLWTLQKKLVPDDAKALDFFGKSVAITGDTIVVGAHGCDDDGLDAGAVYVVTRSGATWGSPTKLLAPDLTDGDDFGTLVAASGDTMVVAADGDDDEVEGKTNVGAAYVFTRSGAGWGPPQRLLASDRMTGYRFGYSLAASGETIVVGAAGNDKIAKTEAAYVFARTGAVWSEQEKLVSVGGSLLDRFGDAVAVGEDFLAVGAPYDDSLEPPNSGTVQVFRLHLDNGEPCADADKCLSGHCVDQVCCFSACADPGMACSASKKGWGKDGICGAVAEASTTGGAGGATATSTTGAGGEASVTTATGAGGGSGDERSHYSCAATPERGREGSPALLVIAALGLAAPTRRRRAEQR